VDDNGIDGHRASRVENPQKAAMSANDMDPGRLEADRVDNVPA
jgi:hypothetical protein